MVIDMLKRVNDWCTKNGCESGWITPSDYCKKYAMPESYVTIWNKIWKIAVPIAVLLVLW
jgi:hypothetical protein